MTSELNSAAGNEGDTSTEMEGASTSAEFEDEAEATFPCCGDAFFDADDEEPALIKLLMPLKKALVTASFQSAT